MSQRGRVGRWWRRWIRKVEDCGQASQRTSRGLVRSDCELGDRIVVHVGFVRLASEDVEVTLVFTQRLAICIHCAGGGGDEHGAQVAKSRQRPRDINTALAGPAASPACCLHAIFSHRGTGSVPSTTATSVNVLACMSHSQVSPLHLHPRVQFAPPNKAKLGFPSTGL